MILCFILLWETRIYVHRGIFVYFKGLFCLVLIWSYVSLVHGLRCAFECIWVFCTYCKGHFCVLHLRVSLRVLWFHLISCSIFSWAPICIRVNMGVFSLLHIRWSLLMLCFISQWVLICTRVHMGFICVFCGSLLIKYLICRRGPICIRMHMGVSCVFYESLLRML